MKTETWKPIADYVGLYEVSNKGRVRNLKTGRILKPGNNGRGYLFVGLYKNGGCKVPLSTQISSPNIHTKSKQVARSKSQRRN